MTRLEIITLCFYLIIQILRQADAGGSFCKDLALKPQPRKEAWNIKLATELAREVREADAGKGYELLFYGDSITEHWRGTDQSGICEMCKGDRDLFQKYFGKYRAGVMAVGGDQIAHLQWRLLHGDIPVIHKPRLAVVMIGTNDLGTECICSHGSEAEILHATKGVKRRLALTIELLQDRMPDTEILMLGILPRGNGFDNQTAWIWPGVFSPAISDINAWLEAQAQIWPGVRYRDCGPSLLEKGKLTPEMFPDGLHPSHEGMDIMGACISEVVENVFNSNSGKKSHHLGRLETISNLEVLEDSDLPSGFQYTGQVESYEHFEPGKGTVLTEREVLLYTGDSSEKSEVAQKPHLKLGRSSERFQLN